MKRRLIRPAPAPAGARTRIARVCAATTLAASLVACGHAAPHVTAAPPPATVDTPAPPAAPSTVPTVLLRGDAATNPACALATPAEIEAAVGGGVTVSDELGVTGPGGYSKTLWSCTWHFADTDISAPAVVVLFERSATVRTEVIAYDKSLITQKYGTGVPGLGDVAVLRGHNLDLVDRTVLMTVRVQLHNDATEPEQTIAVARLVLPRVHR